MSDTISRRAAIDAFLTELTKRERKNLLHTWSTVEVKYFVVDMLEKLPSAQAEIIRCKDCKWYGRVDKRRFYRDMDCLQKHIDTIVPDRDFCSKAERRGEQDG